MSAKWTLASDTTAGDRLLNIMFGSVQLSDGSLVQLVRDPAVADPNSVTLQVVPGPAHTTPQIISTLNAVSVLGTGSFYLSGSAQALVLTKDDEDNLYVLGVYGGVTLGGVTIVYQGWTKGAGLTWTPGAANTVTSTMVGAPAILGLAAVWCNTNGMGGHVAVVANTNGTTEGFFSLNASFILAGTAQHGTSIVTNPAFLGTGLAATSGSNLDIAQESLGATSGIAISSNSLTGIQIGSWGLSSSGILTTGAGINQLLNCGTLSTTTKLRCVKVQGIPGVYAIGYPSVATTGHMTVQSFSIPNGGTVNSVDTPATSNFPTPSATLAWDMASAAPGMNTVWVYAWSTQASHRDDMLRVPIVFGFFSIPALGTVVVDDTNVGGAGTTADNTSIRVVKDPVDFGHVDWQANDATTPFSLQGDFSALPTAPNVPVLLSPANGAALGLASGGTMTWDQLISALLGDAQVSYAFQRQASGGAIRWWDGAGTGGPLSDGWLTTETFVTSAVSSVVFPSGHWTASGVYTWQVAVKGASGVTSGYSSPFTVTVLAPPTAPTLTAAYDPVLDRTTLVIDGSVSTAPIGSIEFSTDGGTTWNFVAGATAIPNVYPGPLTVYHYENSGVAGTQFRARNWSPIPLNYSSYATASVAAADLSSYNLIDTLTGVVVPYLMTVATRQDAIDEDITVHKPAGRPNPITAADAVIGPDGLATGIVVARDGQATFVTQNVGDQAALIALLQLQRELFLQSPVDPPIWIRRLTSTMSEVAVDSAPWATRFENAVTWVTVDRPAP